MLYGKHDIDLVNNLRSRLEKCLKGCGHLGNKDKSLKDTVINIVAGLGLISFITMFCDFIMLNYVSERKIVSDKVVT